MVDTTLTIDDNRRDRLSKHRSDAHNAWNDVLDDLMAIVPTVEDIKDGCINCGRSPPDPNVISETNGVIQFMSTEYDGEIVKGSNYFCSIDCASEMQDEIDSQFPTHPDAVIVGGRSELRTVVEDATFHMDGETREVGLGIPGAFSGKSDLDYEYDYIGEPVYIENDDRIVQEGVINDIIHEETHTALILGHDHEVTRLNHPNEEKREEYKERHAKWVDAECAACGTEIHYMKDEPPEECPDCGEIEW